MIIEQYIKNFALTGLEISLVPHIFKIMTGIAIDVGASTYKVIKYIKNNIVNNKTTVVDKYKNN